MNYLLVDANNLAVRCAFANADLRTKSGIYSGVHYGVINSLISIKNKFFNEQILFVWDSKSKRRLKESEAGVESGIIPEKYKQNRKKEVLPEPLENFYKYSGAIKTAIGSTGIPQITVDGYEADDVISCYAEMLKKDNLVTVITSDKDYYQILDTNVNIFDGMKQSLITIDSFKSQFGLEPKQWVEVGALQGDSGDNIFGVPGFGEKTSISEIQKHGNLKTMFAKYKEEIDAHRNKYPDLSFGHGMGKDEFEEKIAKLKTDPTNENSKLKYPDVKWEMPYTGVLLALENKDIKIKKTMLMALMFEKRIELAYSLKKMDNDIFDLPEIKQQEKNLKIMKEYIEYFEMDSLSDSVMSFFE